MHSLEASIEATTAALRPPVQTTSQPTDGGQAEEEKKAGGKGGKGGKDKGGKVGRKHTLCMIHTVRAME